MIRYSFKIFLWTWNLYQLVALFSPVSTRDHSIGFPSTIAVNVTRLERGFNACQTRRCMYPSIFKRFWHIASYWKKIAKFFISPPIFGAPVESDPVGNSWMYLMVVKLESWCYRMVKKLWRYVKPYSYNTSVWRTDRRPVYIYYVLQHSWRTLKIKPPTNAAV